MKKTWICSLLAVALVCCGSALYAQMQQEGMQGQGAGEGHHMMSPDQRLQRMTRQLNLTTDQQQKMKPILEQEDQQMQTLHSDTSMSQQDRWSKMQQIRQSTNDQIKQVLNPDQQKKFDEMQSRRGGMGPGGMEHGGMGQGQPQQAPPQ